MYEENCRVEAEKEHARYKKQNRILNLCALGLLILLVVWFWALFSLEGESLYFNWRYDYFPCAD